MEFIVQRFEATPHSTIGQMMVDGEFLCYTLEDCIRAVKIQDQTAIWPGRYKLVIDYSERFKRPMPHILDVPEFAGIRIHSGNTDANTDGCILLGLTKGPDFVGQSRDAIGLFMPVLKRGLQDGKEVWITIINPPNGGVQ